MLPAVDVALIADAVLALVVCRFGDGLALAIFAVTTGVSSTFDGDGAGAGCCGLDELAAKLTDNPRQARAKRMDLVFRSSGVEGTAKDGLLALIRCFAFNVRLLHETHKELKEGSVSKKTR